ncbi:MAG: hypothetical protein WBM98_14090 [Maribacter sp.]|uniref:hypothetical protein n=1 Tax=Maribacter sp. TaxID=1897614 RepID=UPI003C70B1D7
MKKLILIAVLFFTGLTIFAQNKEAIYTESTEKVRLQDDFKEIALNELPQAIKASVSKFYPTASIEKVFLSEAGQYKLEMSLKNGTKGTLFADVDGNWLKI